MISELYECAANKGGTTGFLVLFGCGNPFCIVGKVKCPVNHEKCPEIEVKCPENTRKCPINEKKCPVKPQKCPIKYKRKIDEKEEYNFPAVSQRAGDAENPVYTEIGMDLRERLGNDSTRQRLIPVNG